MKILVVIGTSIYEDSSTNYFKRNILKYFNDNRHCEVTVIMQATNVLKKYSDYFPNISFIEYSGDFLFDKIIRFIIKSIKQRISNRWRGISDIKKKGKTISYERANGYPIRIILKWYNEARFIFVKHFYKLYRFSSNWLKNASMFKSSDEFDLILSISHPPASHKLVQKLIENKNVRYKKWIQLWFEIWYQVPLDRKKTSLVKKEEGMLINKADKIFVTHPVFLNEYKSYYPESIKKIDLIDLPCQKSEFENAETLGDHSDEIIDVGYYGSYHSNVRNILPLYNALSKLDFSSRIVGNSDVLLKPKSKISIEQRVPLEKAGRYESKTKLIVIIENLNGNPPGKLYKYATGYKDILYVLDGNENKRNICRQYFSKFNRFIVCENNKDDIYNTIKNWKNGMYRNTILKKPVQSFLVENIIQKMINMK